LFFVILITLIG